jgi:hypothetical protein
MQASVGLCLGSHLHGQKDAYHSIDWENGRDEALDSTIFVERT